MLRVSLRSFSAHKLRVVLTTISVALGVALMAGTYILTDTINASYSQLLGAAYSGESVVVTPSSPLGDNDTAQISPVSTAMLAKSPGRGRRQSERRDNYRRHALRCERKCVGTAGFTYVAGTEPPPFQVLDATQGHLPQARRSRFDVGTATAHGLHIGDVVEVAGAGPAGSTGWWASPLCREQFVSPVPVSPSSRFPRRKPSPAKPAASTRST